MCNSLGIKPPPDHRDPTARVQAEGSGTRRPCGPRPYGSSDVASATNHASICFEESLGDRAVEPADFDML